MPAAAPRPFPRRRWEASGLPRSFLGLFLSTLRWHLKHVLACFVQADPLRLFLGNYPWLTLFASGVMVRMAWWPACTFTHRHAPACTGMHWHALAFFMKPLEHNKRSKPRVPKEHPSEPTPSEPLRLQVASYEAARTISTIAHFCRGNDISTQIQCQVPNATRPERLHARIQKW